MAKRVTIFILIAVLGSSTIAGRAMHAGAEECGMTNMPDCCKLAQMQGSTPAMVAARLCCALNCPQPGTTAPANNLKLSPLAVIPHPAIIQRPTAVLRPSLRFDTRHRYLQDLD